MASYQSMCLSLFNAVTDALRLWQKAQEYAESLYLDAAGDTAENRERDEAAIEASR